jgi:hypothetical protein
MVTVPIEPPRVAEPSNGVVMMLVLLELQVAELVTLFPLCVAVKLTVEPVPPFVVKLIVFPELEVTVTVELAPTVTVVDPLTVPEVAVIVTGLVVSARALTKPVLLTLT